MYGVPHPKQDPIWAHSPIKTMTVQTVQKSGLYYHRLSRLQKSAGSNIPIFKRILKPYLCNARTPLSRQEPKRYLSSHTIMYTTLYLWDTPQKFDHCTSKIFPSYMTLHPKKHPTSTQSSIEPITLMQLTYSSTNLDPRCSLSLRKTKNINPSLSLILSLSIPSSPLAFPRDATRNLPPSPSETLSSRYSAKTEPQKHNFFATTLCSALREVTQGRRSRRPAVTTMAKVRTKEMEAKLKAGRRRSRRHRERENNKREEREREGGLLWTTFIHSEPHP